MIEKIITLENFEVNLYANDWEDAIRKAAMPLLNNKKIKASYIDAMVDSVKRVGPYIVLGNHIALAHARPEFGVNEMSLQFTTLNPPIPFGNEQFDPISLLITLAAIDNESHLDLLSSLAIILMDEENVNRLTAANSNSEMKKVLMELIGL